MLLDPREVRAGRGSHTAFALGTFLQCTLTAVASSWFPAPLLLFSLFCSYQGCTGLPAANLKDASAGS